LIDFAFDNWETDGLKYKGQVVIKDKSSLRSQLTILAGFNKIVYSIDDKPKYIAKSISFAKMDEIEFSKLYNKFIDVILHRVLTNYTKDDINRVVDELLRFD
jgi:hypothetical protein